MFMKAGYYTYTTNLVWNYFSEY